MSPMNHTPIPLETDLALVALRRGVANNLHTRPRWPSRQICIENLALQKLGQIQANLPEPIRLIVTRGYEPASSSLGSARVQFRKLGILLFSALYPRLRYTTCKPPCNEMVLFFTTMRPSACKFIATCR